MSLGDLPSDNSYQGARGLAAISTFSCGDVYRPVHGDVAHPAHRSVTDNYKATNPVVFCICVDFLVPVDNKIRCSRPQESSRQPPLTWALGLLL